MEFRVTRNDLSIAVSNAAGGVPANPPQPIRAGMCIKPSGAVLKFIASDGDVTFKSWCPYESDNDLDAEIILPGKLFSEVVRTLPDQEVIFTVYSDQVEVHAGRAMFRFPRLREPYPQITEPPDFNGGLKDDDFKDIIQKVIPAAAKKDSMPALCGILVEASEESLTVVATDRYRLAVAEAYWATARKDLIPCLIPMWALDKFTRNLSGPVNIGWDDRVAYMDSGTFGVTTRLTQGDFPKWRTSATPDEEPSVEVNTQELLGALRRAQLADDNMVSSVELKFTQGALCIAAGSTNRSDDMIDAKYDQADFTASFGTQYLIDGVNGCGETVLFGFSTPGKPLHLWSGNYKYVIQPRRN
jgi:DNA polymerase-3 subunit beta